VLCVAKWNKGEPEHMAARKRADTATGLFYILRKSKENGLLSVMLPGGDLIDANRGFA